MKNLIFFGAGMIVGAGIGVLAVRGHYRKLAFDEINEARDVFRKMSASKEAALKNSEMKNQILNDISASDAENLNKSDATDATDAKEDSDEVEDTEKIEKNQKFLKKTDATDSESGDLRRYFEIREKYSGENEANESANRERKVSYGKHFNVFSNPPDEENLDILGDDEDEFGDEIIEDPYEIIVDRTAPSDGDSEPYVISEDEFASEKLFYDKVMIEYYTDGVAVLEDSDQIIESIEELIGPDILDEIEDSNSEFKDDNEVYVRNDNRSTDYGIIFTGTKFVPEEGLT